MSPSIINTDSPHGRYTASLRWCITTLDHPCPPFETMAPPLPAPLPLPGRVQCPTHHHWGLTQCTYSIQQDNSFFLLSTSSADVEVSEKRRAKARRLSFGKESVLLVERPKSLQLKQRPIDGVDEHQST